MQTTVSCRIAVVMMQYSIMANSYWLLVEGIYLHNLLVITVFTERNYFKIYLCIGWGELECGGVFIVGKKMKGCNTSMQSDYLSHFFTGTPLIFLLPWVSAKYLYENQE